MEVPALRDRAEDIPLFIEFFLEQTSKELGIEKPRISKDALPCFTEYQWPGNIRELRNVIRRSCLFADENNIILQEALPTRIKKFIQELELQKKISSSLPDNIYDGRPQTEPDLKSIAMKAESKRILEVLEKVRFNKTKAAQLLNIHRKTLYMKLKLMNIQ